MLMTLAQGMTVSKRWRSNATHLVKRETTAIIDQKTE